MKFDKRWERIEYVLKSQDLNHKDSVLPFTPNTKLHDYNSLYNKIYDKEKYVNLTCGSTRFSLWLGESTLTWRLSQNMIPVKRWVGFRL